MPPLDLHPERGAILSEVHARPFHPVGTPQRLIHFAFLTDHSAADRALVALEAFCLERGLEPPGQGRRHFRASFGDTALRWERHNEFISITWYLAQQDEAEFMREASDHLALWRAFPQPGPLLAAVDLHLVPEAAAPLLAQGFDLASLCAMVVEGGAAVVATDFNARADGFVRFRVVDRGLGQARAGAVTQRLLELETYRMLALLGLPEAQRLGPSVRQIEVDLAAVTRSMIASEGLEANRALLDRLTRMAAELEAGAAASLFRFGASRAYDRLVQSRFSALRAEPFETYEDVAAFLNRRMAPAMQTCLSIEERQINLSRKLARAAQLLRTRVEVELEEQNRNLLTALSERTAAQLRLQQTVEGLSIAAVSYYVLGILVYLLQGGAAAGLPVDPKVGAAVVAPLVIAGVASVVVRNRRSHA
jgi:uncharacterized membrane-anchored protein